MVIEQFNSLVRPDTTYTDECHDCGTVWETEEVRVYAECPACGGPPTVPS
jgi:Zn finger protein HypA/HybF involved in hydrogenase expression